MKRAKGEGEGGSHGRQGGERRGEENEVAVCLFLEWA